MSGRSVSGLQQKPLQPQPRLGGDEGLLQPAGQVHHAEVRGRSVCKLLQYGLLQPELLPVTVQQVTGSLLCKKTTLKTRGALIHPSVKAKQSIIIIMLLIVLLQVLVLLLIVLVQVLVLLLSLYFMFSPNCRVVQLWNRGNFLPSAPN